MNVLVINHHFQYDLEALLEANRGKHNVKEVSPFYFYESSKRDLPVQIFYRDGLKEYSLPQYEGHRVKWRKRLARALAELYYIFPFDVIVSPHYVYFYIYDLPEVARQLGIPLIICQKETTRSRFFIEKEALVARKYFPFKANLMTVCGPDQVKFSLACGVPREELIATGQPRFDFYCRPERWLPKNKLGLPEANGKPTILFLTYYLDCAVTNTASYYRTDLWKEIRDQTEDVLVPLAIDSGFNLVIKPHPQHSPTDLERMKDRIRTMSGSSWGRSICFLDGACDLRHVMVHADIVVGFQTTALLEAMVTGKNVIYTFWTDTVLSLQDEILPYHTYEPMLQIARSPLELSTMIQNAPQALDVSILDARKSAFESHLGPLDGRASERFWNVVENYVESTPPGAEQLLYRKQLRASRVEFCRKELILVGRKRFFFNCVKRGLSVLCCFDQIKRWVDSVDRYINLLQQRTAECKVVAKGAEVANNVILGRRNTNWQFRLKSYLYYKIRPFQSYWSRRFVDCPTDSKDAIESSRLPCNRDQDSQ